MLTSIQCGSHKKQTNGEKHCGNNVEEFRTPTSLTSWGCFLVLIENYKLSWTISSHIETVNFVVYVLSVKHMLDFEYITDKILKEILSKQIHGTMNKYFKS